MDIGVARCTRDVKSHRYPDKMLFTKGKVYEVKDDKEGWSTTDDEGKRHIINGKHELNKEDKWFNKHFKLEI